MAAQHSYMYMYLTFDTGYGQFGASTVSVEYADGGQQVPFSVPSSNSPGDYGITPAQVQGGQQLYGVGAVAQQQEQVMMSQVPTGLGVGPAGGLESQQQGGNITTSAGVGESAQIGFDSCE